MFTGNNSNNSNHVPYQACLISNLPTEVQLWVRDYSNYIVLPFHSFLAFISFVCNLFVFITVARTKSLQHPSMLMLCSLSISDLIWAAHILANSTRTILDPHRCPKKSLEEVSIAIFCTLGTVSNMAVISRDRYLSMCWPSWYRFHTSRSRAIKATALTWLASIATTLSAVMIFKLRSSKNLVVVVIIFLFFMLCTFTIMFNYIGFLVASKRYHRQMQRQVRSTRTEREKNLTRIISMIVLSFLFSFMPALIIPLILIFLGFSPGPFAAFFTVLMTINGLLNPVLNYGKNTRMRRAVRNTLSCHRRTRPLPIRAGNNIPTGS